MARAFATVGISIGTLPKISKVSSVTEPSARWSVLGLQRDGL